MSQRNFKYFLLANFEVPCKDFEIIDHESIRNSQKLWKINENYFLKNKKMLQIIQNKKVLNGN